MYACFYSHRHVRRPKHTNFCSGVGRATFYQLYVTCTTSTYILCCVAETQLLYTAPPAKGYARVHARNYLVVCFLFHAHALIVRFVSFIFMDHQSCAGAVYHSAVNNSRIFDSTGSPGLERQRRGCVCNPALHDFVYPRSSIRAPTVLACCGHPSAAGSGVSGGEICSSPRRL